MKWVPVCSLADIPPGKSRPARIGSEDVALFNVEGEVHAIENTCLHAGAALCGGNLSGKVVSCPVHGWRYDVTSGALLIAPEKRVRTFPVAIADGKVMVQVEA